MPAAGTRRLRLREEVLALSRKVLGPEHVTTLGTTINMAISYGDSGRLPEAISLQEQSLAIMRRVLPQNHPHLAPAVENLATCYDKADRKDEAAKLRVELKALKARDSAPAPQ